MPSGQRIVLATHGTLGDVHPYLAIALELQKRGHRPVLATSEFYRGKIEASGIAFHAIRPDVSFDDAALHERLTEPIRGFERVIRELMLPRLRETYEDLLAAVEADGGADLLVSQILIFAAPRVAERTGVRWISTELQPGAFLSVYDPPVLAAVPALARLRRLGPRFHRPLFGLAKVIARRWAEPVLRLRKQLGLTDGDHPLFEGRHSPHRVLTLFSPVIAAPQPDWPPNTQWTGFPFYGENDGALPDGIEQFLNEGEPPVVFTLGSSAVWNAGSFFAESAIAARELGVRAVLLLGKDPRNRIFERATGQLLTATYGCIKAASARAARHSVPASRCSSCRSAATNTTMPPALTASASAVRSRGGNTRRVALLPCSGNCSMTRHYSAALLTSAVRYERKMASAPRVMQSRIY